jgi:MFS family permease
MLPLRSGLARTFRSLAIRNYRLYFVGQLVSTSGTWMQAVAQDWLVLDLTGRALPVGITTGLQFLPVLLFGLWSGALADRFDKRRILLLTQSVMAALALLLALLTATGRIELWMIYGLALLLGCATAVDNPTRQAFVMELVGPKHTANAVSLNSAVFNSARVIGPALAGVLIAGFGISTAFFLNAASFLAVLAALAAMDPHALLREERRTGCKPRIRDGLRHVWQTPELRLPLVMVAVVATLGMNFRVVLPLLARFAFDAGASGYGTLASSFATGSVTGALVTAALARPGPRLLVGACASFGLLSLVAAAAPSLAWEAALLFPLGASGIAFLSTANAMLQLSSRPELRGRVMSLYALVFLGTTPVGAFLVGWLTELFGPRAGLLLACASGFAACLGALLRPLARRRWPQPKSPKALPEPAPEPSA